MPIGIATEITMPTKPKTRPCRSGSTVSCKIVMAEVKNEGTTKPITKKNA
jgi:hypothetical protein